MKQNANLSSIIDVKNRKQFRDWLIKNHNSKDECYVVVKHSKPNNNDNNNLYYLEAVYEALCFGWIDSVKRKINNNVYQRFSPRKKKSHWTELNKARCLMLKDQGLMTEYGIKTQNYDDKFEIDADIINLIKSNKKLFENFISFPNLYKRIRICNIQGKRKNESIFKSALNNFIAQTLAKKMYGNWDDYGLLKKYENCFNFDIK